jgi:hypothetical protein
MKILLKNPSSKLLLQAPGGWTGNSQDALGFSDTSEAIRFAVRHGLWRLRVVLQFNDGSQFIRAVVPGRFEAQIIVQLERSLAALKRWITGILPAQPKSNPFAKSLLV